MGIYIDENPIVQSCGIGSEYNRNYRSYRSYCLYRMYGNYVLLAKLSESRPHSQPRRKKRRSSSKSSLDDEGRYYRFNVDRGLEGIGLESKKKEIAAVTRLYIESQAVFKQMKACANSLAGREC